MARYTGASCKLCRRESQNFSLREKGAIPINVLLTEDHMLRECTASSGKRFRNTESSFVKNKRRNVSMEYWKPV